MQYPLQRNISFFHTGLIPSKPRIVEPTDRRPLGNGCYGSVVAVRCIMTGDIFAAKILRDDFEKDENFETKFYREFGLLHQLEHDHIVRYVGYTTFVDRKFPALLMELLDTNLHAHLESKRNMPLAEKAYILLGVGKGLEYLHRKGVLHQRRLATAYVTSNYYLSVM